MNFLKKALLFLLLGAFFQPEILAQDTGVKDIYERSMMDLTIVSAMGLAGGILGLSTLSFLDEPEENLDNIITGGAIGIIVGVAWVSFSAYQETAISTQTVRAPPYRKGYPSPTGLSSSLAYAGSRRVPPLFVRWAWRF